jgi:hypothetical protein
VDLIGQSEEIMFGTVRSVSDGFTGEGVPYTEVTVQVADKIRGQRAETFTFRQFGLLEPRKINGRTYLGVTPEGWPTWRRDETVLLFVGKPARLTGLRTTVGLGQGKLRMVDGRLRNEADNAGLFARMTVTAPGLSRAQRAMLASNGSPVESAAFIELVRRAVKENWIGKGVMRHAK